jgi:hypothetical protein
MSPDPDHPFDPEEIPYFFDNWCSLPWTPWIPFNAGKHTFKEIPHEPGLYRIRPAGKDFLMYIGETGRTLHQRMSDLRQSLRRSDLMPWSDPLPEAPALWSWWIEWLANQEEEMKCSSPVELAAAAPAAVLPDPSLENDDQPEGAGRVMLECSAAPLDASAAGRKGMEAFLLSTYRQERGESPLCNFGRFHPRYRKSTIRRECLRGGKLAEGHKDNPAGFPSIAPLEPTGKPGDRDWMGLEWTEWKPLAAENTRDVAAGAGLYLLADAGSQEIVYIGRSADVAKRLLDDSRKTWEDRSLQFSYQIIGLSVLPHNLKELQTDLIGNYYESGQVIRPGGREESAGVFESGQVVRPGEGEAPEGSVRNFRKAPEFQFRNSTK